MNYFSFSEMCLFPADPEPEFTFDDYWDSPKMAQDLTLNEQERQQFEKFLQKGLTQ